ncbi:MAG: hypothetical protein AAFY46_14985, partial [Planctomycetota bacterium]
MRSRLTAGMLLGMASVLTGVGIAKLERSTRMDSVIVDASADETEIDALLSDLYACISGAVGQERDWETFDRVFAEDARMAAWFRQLDGTVAEMKMTPAEYKQRSGPMLVASGFSEREVNRELDIYGSIAHAFSTYRGDYTDAQGDAQAVEGINSIQLIKTADGWKVHSLIWQQANPDLPVP